jgi:hypothetical protein
MPSEVSERNMTFSKMTVTGSQEMLATKNQTPVTG